jgi:hypothetical protein
MKVGEQYKQFNEESGLNQSERHKHAFAEDYFHIYDKSTEELIKFILRFSENLVFYNKNDEPEGTFRSVFEGDGTIELFKLTSFNTEKYTNFYNTVHSNYQKDKNKDLLVSFFIEMFSIVRSWPSSFRNIPEFKQEIDKFIEQNIENLYSAFYDHFKDKSNKFEEVKGLFPEQWKKVKPVVIGRRNDAAFAKRLFGILITMINEIVGLGKKFLEGHLKDYKKINPQVSLLLAYLDLFNIAQQEMNKQTSRSLKHFYEQTLQLKKRETVPDSVFLFPQLSANKKYVDIPAGTKFSAGTDDEGDTIKYHTQKEFSLSQLAVEKKLLICRDDAVRESDDETIFDLFHVPAKVMSSRDPFSLGKEKIGIVIQHRGLRLEEGVRKLKFKFTLDDFSKVILKRRIEEIIEVNANLEDLLLRVVNASYSTAEGWEKLAFQNVETEFYETDDAVGIISVSLLIKETDPPITPFENEEIVAVYGNQQPSFKFEFNSLYSSFYNVFMDLNFNGLDVDVDVLGVKALSLSNDFGYLDSSAPFMPFGPTPSIGSGFFIGHPTLFTHPLKELYVNINWYNVPDGDDGFVDYYKDYSNINTNSIFKCNVLFRNNRTWEPDPEPQIIDLFEDLKLEESPEIRPVNDFRGIDNIDLSNFTLSENNADGFNSDIEKSNSGWMKLELCFPPNAFGHKEYNDLVKKSVTEAAKKKKFSIPENEPWVPMIKSISLDYSSTINISLQKKNKVSDGAIIQLQPFGFKKYVDLKRTRFQLIPSIKEGSTMYLGLKNLEAPQSFNLFFALSDFISDFTPQRQHFNWFVLSGSKWVAIEQNQIVEDGTNGFIQSGIIQFYLDKPLEKSSLDILPQGFTWLKLETNSGYNFIKNFTDIRSEAIIATCDFTNKVHSCSNIEPYQIQKADVFISGVNAIEQPYSSFGGVPAENYEEFITRVSERLRHKNRLITPWDYEHLILEEFDLINRVKCLPNTSKDLKRQSGNVLNVLVPFVNKLGHNSHVPSLPLNYLEKVKLYTDKYSSPFANIEVTNPIYEQIQLKFNVRFKKGLNAQQYKERLQKDIIKLFSPWLFDKTVQLNFGNSIRGSSIIYYLENRGYIDIITNLQLLQVVGDETLLYDLSQGGNIIVKPSTPISIFISSNKHLINILGDKVEDIEGINDMSVGDDFLITDLESEQTESEYGIERLTLGFDLILDESIEEDEEVKNQYFVIKNQ